MPDDNLLCQSPTRCAECPWSGPRGCRLEAELTAALDSPAIPLAMEPRTPARGASPHAWSDAGLVFDDPSARLAES